MIIAIDGPSGSGKSTIARALSKRLGIMYLDTGAMYRSLTYLCLQKGVPTSAEAQVEELAKGMDLSLKHVAGELVVELSHTDVSQAIRSAEVDAHVSEVAKIPSVREIMCVREREFGRAASVIAEGRDIGSVVFPQAEVKVFLTCDAATRAHRRVLERPGTDEQSVYENLLRRDKIDSTRAASPLVCPKDAHVIDSTNKTVEEIVEEIARLAKPYLDVVEKPKKEAPQDSALASSDSPRVAASSVDSPRVAASSSHDERLWSRYYTQGMAHFPWYARVLFAVVCVLSWIVTKLLWRWRVELAKNDSFSKDKPRIIVMNHVSAIEPLLCVVFCFMHGIRVRAMYKSEFNKHPIVAHLLAYAGGIPVRRGSADMACIRSCQDALARGEWLLIYPEGTRVKDPTRPHPIHGGFALLSARTCAPVLPCAVVGAYTSCHAKSLREKFCTIYFKLGDEISLSDIPSESEFKPTSLKAKKVRMEALEKRAMECVYALRDELSRAHPGLL